jgi:hypothetical protein
VPIKTGRPPLDRTDSSVPVNLKLPSRQYDDTYRRAAAARVSVPEMIRRDLRRATADDADDADD